ncbi:uncharacterized protein LOC115723376 isoform X1 [Cannabis sativa]|uniref:uncharacterized protein LOC115723376 isoform X1 n=1 Tax=Cannabis sativa TaxID=3483 RepID=UPI0029CAAB3D|nr:uncharacterized protein LOC115723376 isoform X1 [Cannabis sativa]XP_030508703.2 uncharacterized protein LOC115723376 isoform X1 [Cannabis sativa]
MLEMTEEVCPMEDALLALLDNLVGPVLPARFITDNPPLSHQQVVAKQVHAVVLLYNYYHRKKCPKLDFLGFESFCKLAVVLKPALLVHFKLTQMKNYMKLDDLENHLSPTEKSIMQACDISTALDASRKDPIVEGWPITKVAVFLIDLKKENCLLLDSVTQGVYSVIEKDVEASNQSLRSTMGKSQTCKRNKVIQKIPKVEPGTNSTDFQQLAYLAVLEATGVNQTDLTILEDHVVYSDSKEKAAVQFYIMQAKSVTENIIQFPIKDVIDSLQGPLVRKISGNWTVTPVVEYFHLLPYGGILLNWMKSLHDSRQGKSPERTTIPRTLAENKIQVNFHAGGIREVNSHKTTATDLKSPKDEDAIGFSNASNEPGIKEENVRKYIELLRIKVKFEMDLTTKSNSSDCAIEKASFGNRISDISSGQNGFGCRAMVAYHSNGISDKGGNCYHTLATYQSSSQHLEKIQSVMASKHNLMTETALKLLRSRRNKLSLKLRDIEDEIAEYDRKMETIINGGEDDLQLVLESLIEGGNEESQRSAADHVRTNQRVEDTLDNKRKRLSEAILSTRNARQELDDICDANNWILPIYHINPAQGGYIANVSIQGAGFECSSEGEVHSSRGEARESAAALILVKLRMIATRSLDN